ncbi:SprT family protein [Bacillus taeanensis]|uniref:Protein SprT-like n=1 Tax=Bacillus taeanensis TaxID=273032 RepID=A0A366XQ64_9BACI|nr:SprT family protein [Bacillus taeanensis]RBW67856.1 SprT family protein [Bacillus taeanensis]
MNEQELQKLVEDLSIRYFMKPFLHNVRFNNRLRTTGGRYLLKSHDIEINPKQLEAFGKKALVEIIKHELCHYHLHLEGKGYKHRDQEFKTLLKRVGGSRYCERLPGMKRKEEVKHYYICKDCSQVYSRKRRIDTTRYVCGKCRGKLKQKSG